MNQYPYVAKISPQRATQYDNLAEALAHPELALSPLGSHLASMQPVRLAGQSYLQVQLDTRPASFPRYATVTEWFEYFSQIHGEAGPFLRPVEPRAELLFTDNLVEARRYRGKTNELFSHFLVNVARWAHQGNPNWLLDPLAGGGTTLFTGLRLGLNVMGVERDKQSVNSTDTFLKQYLQAERLKYKREQQKRQVGFRVRYELPHALQFTLALGDTREVPQLLDILPGAPLPDLVVADLPYSVQHRTGGATLQALLEEALTVWQAFAAPGAVLVLSWNATAFSRAEMVEQVERGGWSAMTGGVYERVAHRVDRVIKKRDVVVATKQAK